MTQTEIWIERWRAGDERAAEALYNHHRAAAYQLAYGLLGNADDAEEAAQDALIYALMNIQRYDPRRASFATWLHTITVSRCRDRQRRKRLPRIALSKWLGWGHGVAAPEPGPEERALTEETRSRVWEAVQALSPPLREAVILRYWAGHTYREMSDIMDCPLPTAQSRVRLAYKHLRTRLRPAELTQIKQQEEVR